MSDTFEYLTESAIDETITKPYPILVRGRPILTVTPATFDSADYKREHLAGAPRRKSAAEREKMSEAAKAADDQQYELALADLFARAVVKAWEPAPLNDKGERSAFTVENVRTFLQTLVLEATWAWEGLRDYCSNRLFWITIPEAEAKEVAGKSEGASDGTSKPGSEPGPSPAP